MKERKNRDDELTQGEVVVTVDVRKRGAAHHGIYVKICQHGTTMPPPSVLFFKVPQTQACLLQSNVCP